jgi:hypothetical protein
MPTPAPIPRLPHSTLRRALEDAARSPARPSKSPRRPRSPPREPRADMHSTPRRPRTRRTKSAAPRSNTRAPAAVTPQRTITPSPRRARCTRWPSAPSPLVPSPRRHEEGDGERELPDEAPNAREPDDEDATLWRSAELTSPAAEALEPNAAAPTRALAAPRPSELTAPSARAAPPRARHAAPTPRAAPAHEEDAAPKAREPTERALELPTPRRAGSRPSEAPALRARLPPTALGSPDAPSPEDAAPEARDAAPTPDADADEDAARLTMPRDADDAHELDARSPEEAAKMPSALLDAECAQPISTEQLESKARTNPPAKMPPHASSPHTSARPHAPTHPRPTRPSSWRSAVLTTTSARQHTKSTTPAHSSAGQSALHADTPSPKLSRSSTWPTGPHSNASTTDSAERSADTTNPTSPRKPTAKTHTTQHRSQRLEQDD